MAEGKEPTLVDVINQLISMEKKIYKAGIDLNHQTGKIQKLEEIINNQQARIEVLENETRKKNIIITGIPEENNEDVWMLKEKVLKEVIGRIGVTIADQEIDFINRVGTRRKNTNRPIKMGLTTTLKKIEMLKKSSGLKETKIAVNEDLDKTTKDIQKKIIRHEIKAEDIYRKVQGVLNKLTPQKFKTLLGQIRSLNIDNVETLQNVIDLIYVKAVDEPNFSAICALLCRELALMQIRVSSRKKEGQVKVVNFRELLVTRCQLEFEKGSIDDNERARKIREIDDCNDPEKKKDLQLDLDEYNRWLRMRSVGNIRFIGELFKQEMLGVKIMLRCLNNLLETEDEESLECLCTLLNTIGKELETKKVDLNTIFGTMKDIADRKYESRISSRVRCMIQDLIDLRSSRWVPCRQDLNPKTMDQIQKEAENEHLTIQAMNSVLMTPRRDGLGEDGGGGNPSSDTKRGGINASNDEVWSTATSRGSRTPFTVQSDKLKYKPPMMDEAVGSSQMLGSWRRGLNIKTQPQPSLTNTANMYAALENIGTESDDKRPALGSRRNNKDPYSSKGPSLERTYRQSYKDGRGSRSGSQHRSYDSSTASLRNTTPAPVPSAPKAQPQFGAPPLPVTVELTPDQLERRLNNILEEYLNECCTIEECDQDIKSSISQSALPQLVSYGYIKVLERSKMARLQTGFLFAQFIKLGTLSLQDYCAGLDAALAEADKLMIDIPKMWDYVAECIAPVLCESVVTLNDMHKSFELLISKNHMPKLLLCLFKLIIQEKGPNFLQNSWNSSGFTFADYMPESHVESYIKDNKFEFLLEKGNSPAIGQSHLSYDKIHNKLLALFKAGTSFDDIINWITANVGERVMENLFVRTLATAVFKNSIVNLKLKIDILEGKYRLLHRFVDKKLTYELQCLFALQALINKLEHPQGLLLAICDKLYEENIFSHESFVAWETSTDPAEQEGKAVALKQLASFFTQLKEADEDSSSSEDA